MTNKTHRSCAATSRGHERTIFPASNGLLCAQQASIFSIFPIVNTIFSRFHFVGSYISISIGDTESHSQSIFFACFWADFVSVSIFRHRRLYTIFLLQVFACCCCPCWQLDNRSETNKYKEL